MTKESILDTPPSKMSIDRVKKNFLTGYRVQSGYQRKHYWDAMEILNEYETKKRGLEPGDYCEAESVESHEYVKGVFSYFDQSADVQRCGVLVDGGLIECFGDSLRKIKSKEMTKEEKIERLRLKAKSNLATKELRYKYFITIIEFQNQSTEWYHSMHLYKLERLHDRLELKIAAL